MNKPPPKDRQARQMVLQLCHAQQTGQFPYTGGLADQPARVQEWFELVQTVEIRTRGLGHGTP
jgi:hypothetical protein